MVIKTEEWGWRGEGKWVGAHVWMTENVIVNEVGAGFLGYSLLFPRVKTLTPSLPENLGCYSVSCVSGYRNEPLWL